MVLLQRVRHGIGAALALAAPGWAQRDFALDPKTYSSPSGEVKLFVDPSRSSGAGPASYRCTRSGAELWSGTRPYTLWEAAVTDDGLVAGYAYEAGYEGGRDDALTIVLIAPDGKARLEERSERKGFLSCIGSPDPIIAGLFLDPDNDRFVVRARTGGWGGAESWWTYSLSRRERGPRLDPSPGAGSGTQVRWIEEARAIPGTSLVLVRHAWMDFHADQYGAVFRLLDRDAHGVWRLDWREDYTIAGDYVASDRLVNELRERGVILSVERGRFTLRQVAKNERVTFEVEQVTGTRKGLQVREVARSPLERVASEPGASSSGTGGAAETPTLSLEHLGTIRLGAPASSSPIRDVMTFALDGLGRPGFLRRSGDRFEFVRVDQEGGNAIEIQLPAPPEEGWSLELAWTSGERWVVTGSTMRKAPNAWWLDAAKRTATPIDGFAGPTIGSIAGTPDGGFVVLGTTYYDSGYFTSDLVAFGSDGKRLFALGGDQGDPQDPKTLFAPEALAVLDSGEIVVLGNITKRLQFFSGQGEFLRVVDLAAAWGREPNYPTGVHPDANGGLVVHDSNGNPPVVRIDGTGKVQSALAPHYPDGRHFYPRGDVRVSRDGNLWTSDGDALVVIDAEGVVQRVLGSAPNASVLGKIGALTLGPDGRIYAADERTGAVHVFRPDGTPLHVCATAPDDFPNGVSTQLTVTDTNEVYLGRVHFGADGARLEKSSLRVDQTSNTRYWQRGSDRSWIVGYEALYLVTPEGEVVRKIERTPDDKWLRGLDRASVAPDGSIALATSDHLGKGNPGIHLYSANGDALRSLPAPDGMISWATFAFDGVHLAVGVQHERRPGAVVWMDAQASTLRTFTPQGEVEAWIPFFAARGKELWLFDLERTIERFAVP